MDDPTSPAPGLEPVIGTPEGDNEFAPGTPLTPLPDGALQEPPGSKPGLYRQP